MTDPRDASLDGLLTIDVESELRKLATAQLQGPWQLPTELVRRSVRAGAHGVRVRVSRREVEIVDDGRPLAVEQLESLAAVLDPEVVPTSRHTALTRLEEQGEVALMALAGLNVERLTLRTDGNGRERILTLEKGRRPRLEEVPTRRTGTTVLVSGEAFGSQARAYLRTMARYCPTPVGLEGEALAIGPRDHLGEAKLPAPVPGRVWIPRTSDTAHVWLLHHGIVVTRVAVPNAPAFEAAVELPSSASGGGLDAAAARQAFAAHLDAVLHGAAGCLMEAARGLPNLPPSVHGRVTRLLLHTARRRTRLREVLTVPAFRVLDGATGETSWVDLVTMRAHLDRGKPEGGGPRQMRALDPDQQPSRFALGPGPVAILGEAERSLLSDLLGVHFVHPPLRDRGGPWMQRVRRAVETAADRTGRAWDILTHPGRTPLEDGELTDDERALLQALREFAPVPEDGAPIAIDMCEGGGRVRTRTGSQPAVLLPRGNPRVRACVRAIATAPAWAYPVHLLLLRDFGRPPARLQRLWWNAGEA